MRLEGKTVLITGAARGLGAAMARRFAEEGAAVFIGDLNTDEGNNAAEAIRAGNGGAKGARAFFTSLDVTSEQSWINALAFVRGETARFGLPPLNVLVNNAGINIREPVELMAVENLDAMLAVNVKGPFLGIKHVIPLLRQCGGGLIINISSVCGLVGHAFTT
ncbi:MAG: SDR family NAD(P)-dependent oxidoreductase, partial [Treponema sp.]|nr:SDR family NAD(P)-dependent oxidoreductase [Treponema sp.]